MWERLGGVTFGGVRAVGCRAVNCYHTSGQSLPKSSEGVALRALLEVVKVVSTQTGIDHKTRQPRVITCTIQAIQKICLFLKTVSDMVWNFSKFLLGLR